MDQQKTLYARKFERAAGGGLPPALVAGLQAAAEKGLGQGLRCECSGLAEATAIRAVADWAEASGEGIIALIQAPSGPPPGFLHGDLALATAATELLTAGDVARPDPPHQARGTEAEAALSGRLLDLWYAELLKIAGRDGLLPTLAGTRLRRAESLAQALPHLPEGHFRFIRLGLDLGSRGRHGVLTLAVPAEAVLAEYNAASGAEDWSLPMAALAAGVRPELSFVLARERLTLGRLGRLRPGDLLPLEGARMPLVRVETRSASGGVILLGEGELGASGGRKALRPL